MSEQTLMDKCKQHWCSLGISNMDGFKKRVRLIFKEQDNQADVLVEIYKLVFPEWDEITKVNGFPKAGHELWKFICREFIEFDRKYHPKVMAGGIWMNTGFCSSEHLDPWELSFEDCSVEY